MAEAMDIYGTAFKNGSATLMARIVGAAGVNIAQADIATIRYSVYLLDEQDPDGRTPVYGHSQITLPVYQVVFNSLQTDATWTVDAIGYNFRHVLDISVHPAFAVADRKYLIEYALTPLAGQIILVRYRINLI
ncbi:MAG: hypothetical protein ABSA26_03025 [Thermoguttaceae bacterium]|jgi:hypothetical protein